MKHEKVKSFSFFPLPANECTDIKDINTTQVAIVICGVWKALSV